MADFGGTDDYTTAGEAYYAEHGWSGRAGAAWSMLPQASRDEWEAAAREAIRAVPAPESIRDAVRQANKTGIGCPLCSVDRLCDYHEGYRNGNQAVDRASDHTRWKRGWWCSRTWPHDGPCALRPRWWNLAGRRWSRGRASSMRPNRLDRPRASR